MLSSARLLLGVVGFSVISGCVTVILGTDQTVNYSSDVAQSFSDNLLGNGKEQAPLVNELLTDEDEND